ncbi:MAG: hypothetical protein R2725_14325 [Solirubrobacterales bacterium]
MEAMQCLQEPLSARDLEKLFGGDPNLSLVSYHLRQLEKLDAIDKVGFRQVRGAVESFYYLSGRYDSAAG